jgi:DNA-binding transcriptional MocR family regulator
MAVELAGQRVAMDMAGSVIDQVLALALLRRGDEIVEERKSLLRARRTVLEAALRREAPEWTWRTPAGGMSLWVDLGEPSAAALCTRARAYGVQLESGSRFGVDPGTFEQRIRIPYTLPVERLEEAAQRLAAAFRCEEPPLAAAGAVSDGSRWVA